MLPTLTRTGRLGEGQSNTGRFDCPAHPVYDEKRRRWLFYFRPFIYSTGLPMHGPHTHYRRRIAFSTTSDFRKFTPPRCVMFPEDGENEHFDNIRLFNHEGLLMGLLATFEESEDGLGEIPLAWSRDGVNWRRSPADQPFIPRGGKGEFDHGLVIGCSAPLIVGGEMWFYYRGLCKGHYYHDQVSGFGLAKTEIDRFVSVRGDDQPGYLLTKELIADGDMLTINAQTDFRPGHPPGEIKVALASRPDVDGFGRELAVEGFGMDDCDRIKTNGTRHTVTWNGSFDLSSLKGRSVYIRFRLINADLYSFAFRGMADA